MSWFSGNTYSDSEGDSSATEGPTQSRTSFVWGPPIHRTTQPPLRPLSTSSTPRPAASHRISLLFHRPETGSHSREGGDRRVHSSWRNLNVPSWCELPAELEPLVLSISTFPEPTPTPVPEPDITITRKEESYEPAWENSMEGATARPMEYKAGLSEDSSRKNEDATWWLLAMKAYFIINEGVYKDEKIVILTFLNKLSKGRGATFRTEPTKLYTPSAWTSSMEISTNTPPHSNWLKLTVEWTMIEFW